MTVQSQNQRVATKIPEASKDYRNGPEGIFLLCEVEELLINGVRYSGV